MTVGLGCCTSWTGAGMTVGVCTPGVCNDIMFWLKAPVGTKGGAATPTGCGKPKTGWVGLMGVIVETGPANMELAGDRARAGLTGLRGGTGCDSDSEEERGCAGDSGEEKGRGSGGGGGCIGGGGCCRLS